MGIIDTNNYTVKCESCGVVETAKVHDKGNRYSGSDWQSRGNFTNFESSWKHDDDRNAPDLLSAKCKSCGTAATLQKTFYTQ